MCAIFGVYHTRKAAELCVIGLHSMQHRAIDFAGIVSNDGRHFYREAHPGLVRIAFTAGMLERLHGLDALGHLRYPTVQDGPGRDNIQPLQGIYDGKPISIAHNGNLTNVDALKLDLNMPFATSLDSECILRLFEKYDSGDIVVDAAKVFSLLEGSYALCIMLPDVMIAVRDPTGNRPLSYGVSNGGYFVSSETCALTAVDAEGIEDIRPGELVSFSVAGVAKHRLFESSTTLKQCRFESIYLGLPSSTIFGKSVATFRRELGIKLEEVCPAHGADIVTPVPDSAMYMAVGYGESQRSGVYMPVILRNHYVGRTFIAATQAKRDAEVVQKFSFASDEIRGKSIVLVDDSIVRGTTLPKIVRKLRTLGAKAVHVRIGSPPTVYPCRYGINTPTSEELIAAHQTPEEIRMSIDADSLEYLPLEVLRNLSPQPDSFCYACMNGEYW